MAKVAVELDKHAWRPSPLPGQIVLVATLNGDATPNVAPKSWISLAAFEGPIVGFGCTVEHATCRNVLERGVFTINVVPAALAPTAWRMVDSHGADRLAESGLTLVPAQVVAAPLVAECTAHLECRLDDVKRWGEEAFLFGRVLALSVDEEVARGGYERLQPVFFLEERLFAPLGAARRVG